MQPTDQEEEVKEEDIKQDEEVPIQFDIQPPPEVVKEEVSSKFPNFS